MTFATLRTSSWHFRFTHYAYCKAGWDILDPYIVINICHYWFKFGLAVVVTLARISWAMLLLWLMGIFLHDVFFTYECETGFRICVPTFGRFICDVIGFLLFVWFSVGGLENLIQNHRELFRKLPCKPIKMTDE